jgi:general secretion pathway protein N
MARREMRSLGAPITLAAMLLLSRADAFVVAVPPLVVNPSDIDIMPGGTNSRGASPGSLNAAPEAPAQNRLPADAPASGNPLWAIPLKQLSATRDRPIFAPSRRPPAPAVANAPHIQPVLPRAVMLSEPERPPLTLVGLVVSEHEGIGVFVEQNTKNVVRLRMGESHFGWILRHIEGREATLEKNRQTAVLTLPQRGSEPSEGSPLKRDLNR